MMSLIFGDRPWLRIAICRSASTATKLPREWASTEISRHLLVVDDRLQHRLQRVARIVRALAVVEIGERLAARGPGEQHRHDVGARNRARSARSDRPPPRSACCSRARTPARAASATSRSAGRIPRCASFEIDALGAQRDEILGGIAGRRRRPLHVADLARRRAGSKRRCRRSADHARVRRRTSRRGLDDRRARRRDQHVDVGGARARARTPRSDCRRDARRSPPAGAQARAPATARARPDAWIGQAEISAMSRPKLAAPTSREGQIRASRLALSIARGAQ